MEKLIGEIKQKPEFKDLPDSFIKKILQNYIDKHNLPIPDNKKSRKLLIKIIRSELRTSAGQYVGKNRNSKDALSYHKSTNERLNEYDYIKSKIEELNAQSILDLGCGMNPIAIAKKGIRYYAYDIKYEYLDRIKEHFIENNITGEVHHEDITQITEFPQVDLCLMLKLLDILGKNKKEISKKLITKIDSEYFIISFATKTLSGKEMNRPYRRWFEKLLKELKLECEIHRTSNELFYIIKKSKK